jgi:DNA-binding FadR family transcriptional regulator
MNKYDQIWNHTAKYIASNNPFLMMKLETVWEQAQHDMLYYRRMKYARPVTDCIREYDKTGKVPCFRGARK